MLACNSSAGRLYSDRRRLIQALFTASSSTCVSVRRFIQAFRVSSPPQHKVPAINVSRVLSSQRRLPTGDKPPCYHYVRSNALDQVPVASCSSLYHLLAVLIV
ncbi:hypothetical protein AcV5_000962 [Taiwanofungus camphoratus]|nr:hypothetical protein AcV5_000962 [Antrodia cinnamomea]